MYPSDQPEAKRQRKRVERQRQREAGYTEILLVLSNERVAELDALKEQRGLCSRSQAADIWLEAGRESTPKVTLEPLNFRVPADFRREFKVFAAAHGLKLNELLRRCFEAYQHHQKN